MIAYDVDIISFLEKMSVYLRSQSGVRIIWSAEDAGKGRWLSEQQRH